MTKSPAKDKCLQKIPDTQKLCKWEIPMRNTMKKKLGEKLKLAINFKTREQPTCRFLSISRNGLFLSYSTVTAFINLFALLYII